ncbi:MAG: RNA pyrophosphohydrolase [Gammaproteobacteria bacterium]|nr:RNA pyrophosphohydrolase [Gammaproteobacteria bacterium]|tara:strand:+ start:5117 stop:5602 length:486 start_codon:yes stop_codon:yes gene_type:complete
MKEIGYRLNVGLIVANKKGQLLLCKRKGMNSWQFPQGGIDFTEGSLKAAKRELYEEVGIKSKSVKLINSLDDWLKYDVPKKSRRRKLINSNFKGQKQKWFLFRLKENVEISFENDPDNEFDDFKWVSYWYPLNVIISFKEKVYREALNKLKYSFFDEFSNV